MRVFAAVAITLALLVATATAILLVARPWGGGAEAVYTLSLPPDYAGTPTSAAEAAGLVLERRARLLGHDAHAVATPDGRVILRVAGLKPGEFDAFREALERRGRLEFLAVADAQTQKRYNEDGKVPPDFRVARAPSMPGGSEYEPWSKGPILLAEPPLVVTSDLARTDPQQAMGLQGVMWHVALELHPPAADRFDAVAKRLYHARPPGMVAIVVDGRVVSTPSIRAEVFGGRLVVSGAKDEKEARAWAVSWGGGELPCLLRPPKVEAYRGRLR